MFVLWQTVTLGVLGDQINSVMDALLATITKEIVGQNLLLISAAISSFSAVSTDVFYTSNIIKRYQ
ncbi:MAG: hypothetical protein ACI9QN_002373 [Arcticibacterium sp.]|jgi:hypothetical protein